MEEKKLKNAELKTTWAVNVLVKMPLEMRVQKRKHLCTDNDSYWSDFLDDLSLPKEGEGSESFVILVLGAFNFSMSENWRFDSIYPSLWLLKNKLKENRKSWNILFKIEMIDILWVPIQKKL